MCDQQLTFSRHYYGYYLKRRLRYNFCKDLCDRCIVGNHYDSLRSADLQFAYISAIHCVNSVNETVTSIIQVKLMYVYLTPLKHLIGLTH